MPLHASAGVGIHADNNAIMTKGRASNFDHNIPLVLEDTQHERIEGFVLPTGGVAGNGPYDFVLPAVNDAYLMLGNLSLYVKAKVVQGDGSNLINDNIVAPVNCLGIALWEHIELSLNDYAISNSSASNSHYKGVLETLLSYDHMANHSHLKAQIYEEDQPGRFNIMVREAENVIANKGFTNRERLVRRSKEFDFMSPLTADFLRTDKHLAPGNKLAIKLYRARDDFILNSGHANANFKLLITDMRLYYQRIRLKEKFGPPKIERYLYTKTELKRFPIPQGMSAYDINLHQGGKMPKSVIITQVRTAAAEGAYGENPFYFPHFNINSLCLKINGQRLPSEPLRPDFEETDEKNALVAREFVSMFMNTGLFKTDRGNCITYKTFRGGLTIFPFDLNVDMCNGYHLHSAKEGSISIELGWANPLPDPIVVMVHCSYDEVLTRKAGDGDTFQVIQV